MKSKTQASLFALAGVLIAPAAVASNIAYQAPILESTGGFNANFGSEKAFDGAVRDAHPDALASYWLSGDGQGGSAYFVADLGSSQQVVRLRTSAASIC